MSFVLEFVWFKPPPRSERNVLARPGRAISSQGRRLKRSRRLRELHDTVKYVYEQLTQLNLYMVANGAEFMFEEWHPATGRYILRNNISGSSLDEIRSEVEMQQLDHSL